MEFSPALVGVIITILIHGAASIWWASRITTQIQSMTEAFLRLDRELEKRDSQIKAAWAQIDNLKDRMVRVESNCKLHDKLDG